MCVYSISESAVALHDAGLNVFPIRPGEKLPYGSHSFLTTTRLPREELSELVADSNLAVMCGRLSQNLFVPDCDSAKTFQFVGTELKKRGIQPWIRNGAHGGEECGQYWLRCADGEVANKKIGKIDILGNRKYTACPPSIHPTGMLYEWIAQPGSLPPLVSLSQLDFLPLHLESRAGHKRTEKKNALPTVANAVLVERNVRGYDSHSEAEYAASLSLIGAGKSDETICELFRHFSPPHYAKNGMRHFQRYTLAAAHEWRDTQQDTPSKEVLSAPFIQWAQNVVWTGRTGNTDKSVYLALCERLQQHGDMPFRASMRELAELANLSKEAVQRSMQRLKHVGRVACHGSDKVAGSYEYTLFVPEDYQADDVCKVHTLRVDTLTNVSTSVCTLHTDHDAWNGRALGKPCLFCYQQLGLQAGTLADLVGRLGKHRSTVSRTLLRLEQNGLVRREGEVWNAVEVSLETLDRIALLCGTAGKSQERVDKHAMERAARAADFIRRQKQRSTCSNRKERS